MYRRKTNHMMIYMNMIPDSKSTPDPPNLD